MRERSAKHGPSGSQSHSRSKSRSKKNIKCYHCGKKVHVKRECWQLKKNGDFRGKDPKTSTAQGNIASTLDDGEILYSEVTTFSKDRRQLTDVWLVDSGAKWHIISHRK